MRASRRPVCCARFAFALVFGLGLSAAGCVTLYQPLGELQRPVLVGLSDPNFEGTRVRVRCVSSQALPPADAQKLCRNVSELFRNQGAEAEAEVPRRGARAFAREGNAPPDLIVELSTRNVRVTESPWLGALFCFTCTLVPYASESIYAQRVAVYDGSGNLLASDEMPARFIDYVGALIWLVNGALDLFVRSPEQHVTGDAPLREFSRDYYGQVSQLTYNARVRQQLLSPAPPSKGAAEGP